MKQAILPPDDVGNRKEPIESSALLPDDSGNRVDLPPTHEISGVLADLDGRRRRKKKTPGNLMRIGRYFVGGVNPLVSGIQPPVKPVTMPTELVPPNGEMASEVDEGELDEDGLGRKKRRRRRRRDGREQIDGAAIQEVSVRRAQRFFDFEEDDRFEYVLKSDAQSKCDAARDAVASVLRYAKRDACVEARVIEDRDRPKVVVTIEENGPAGSSTAEGTDGFAGQPLFVLGNAALMALNYLVNKIVNRYPDDRIRLAILPKADEALYLDSLAQHLKSQADKNDSADVDAVPEAHAAPLLNGKALENGVSNGRVTRRAGRVGLAEDAAAPTVAEPAAPTTDAIEAIERIEESEAPKKKTRARTAKTASAKTETATAAKGRGAAVRKAAAPKSVVEGVEEAPAEADEENENEDVATVKKSAARKKATQKVAKKATQKVAKKSEPEAADAEPAAEETPKAKKAAKKTPVRASKKAPTSRKTKATKTKTQDEAEDT